MKNIYAERLKEERVINLLSSRNTSTGSVFRTFLIRFPKILLAELNTHRMLVRNCGSSRAIPTETFINNILDDPYIPTFTRLQKGMVGEQLPEDDKNLEAARQVWNLNMEASIKSSQILHALKIHKQNANRVLEPYTYVDLVLSGTEWDNFLHLRTASDAQLDFKVIADKIGHSILHDTPVDLEEGQWHIPFKDTYYSDLSFEQNIQVCIARIARVSYMTHGSDEIDLEKDIKLAAQLLESGHLSPLEHVARASESGLIFGEMLADLIDPQLQKYLFWDWEAKIYRWTRNYAGFYTYRHHIEDGVKIK